MFDDPGKKLQWMKQALLEEEPEEAFDEDEEWEEEALEDEDNPYVRPHNPMKGFSRSVYEDETYEEPDAVFAEEPRRRGSLKMVLMVIVDLAVIFGLIGWWTGWWK